jgi:hypothetical protein
MACLAQSLGQQVYKQDHITAQRNWRLHGYEYCIFSWSQLPSLGALNARGPYIREASKFARHLKWACPNRKWACSRKNGCGPNKREARGICRICHVVNPALGGGSNILVCNGRPFCGRSF